MFITKTITEIVKKGVFKKGRIGFYVENGNFFILYKQKDVQIAKGMSIQHNNYHNLKEFARNVLIDLYYDYEWDGKCVGVSKLSVLLGMTNMGMFRHMQNIMRKLVSNRYLLDNETRGTR